jgi:signal transduction histidine kinase
MRVTQKIVASILTILALGVASMIIIFYGLQKLGGAIHNLASSKQPLSAAAYEMEINVLGIATGTLSYLNHPDKNVLDSVRKDEQDFERFHSQYLKLAETLKEKEMANRMEQEYRRFKDLGEALIQQKQLQLEIYARIGNNFESMDKILDERIENPLYQQKADELVKLANAVDLESDVAELGISVAFYRENRTKEAREKVRMEEQEFRNRFKKFMELPLTSSEKKSANEIAAIFEETVSSINEALRLDTYFQEETEKFMGLRSSIDALLDEEIQVLTARELGEPKTEADQVAKQVVSIIQILIPLFLISAGLIGYLLVRAIRDPVKKLVKGTNVIGEGDLRYRIDMPGRDEFANLANQFNQMVERLEATTVSKSSLESSEAMLRQAVDDLRKEILDRERAEKEQARLQAELHRSEIMATMGTLVAGVAHEARNPLFGISSIIDALDARLEEAGTHEKYAEHLRILRDQISRLTKLMGNLLEYGKPSNLEFIIASIDPVISEAIKICEPLASQSQVLLKSEVRTTGACTKMDKNRLVEVFKNLIENAIQHSPPGGIVAIETDTYSENGGSRIQCAVKDSGPGFPPDEMSKVFEPFFSRRRQGTGLGLSIVQRVVEGHNGKVIVGNRSEGGAVVTVSLPIQNELSG